MSDEATSLSKWKVVLAVGVGVAAVVGVSALAYVALSSRRASRAEASNGRRTIIPETVESNAKNSGSAATVVVKSDYERALEIKLQGNDFYKQQKYDDAVRCYQAAIAVCPEDKKDDMSKFHHNIAAVYTVMAENATDPAEKERLLHSVLEHCSQALEHNKRYIKALARRLKAYESLGMKKEALLDVTRIVILDETQGTQQAETITGILKDLGKDQALVEFPKLGPLAPTDHIIKTFCETFVWQDDLSEEKLKELWDEHAKEMTGESQQLAEKEEEDGAEGELQGDQGREDSEQHEPLPEPDQSKSIEESHGSYADFYKDPFVRAAAMFRQKKYHGILEVITEAVEKGCPVFLPHALLLRGTFYIMWRENMKALADLDAVVNMKGLPDTLVINALIKKSTVYAGLPDMEKVKICFDKCLSIDDSCPDVLIHRARMLLESPEDPKSLEAVIEDLKRALELEPQSAYAMFSLGTAYHRVASIMQSAQMLSLATTTFEEASKKFPTFVDGLVLYAMCLQDINQVSKALELLNKAVKMQPDNPTVHLSLGVLSLVSQNDPVKAVACMEKAIAVDNSCIQAYDTLASVEIQKGNSEQALDYYNRATRFSRSQVEMGQVMVAREVIASQQQVCKEYGVSVKELISRVMPAPML